MKRAILFCKLLRMYLRFHYWPAAVQRAWRVAKCSM